MNQDFAQSIIRLFERLTYEMEPEMREVRASDLIIQAPGFIIEAFATAVDMTYMHNHRPVSGDLRFRGIQILPGYELEVVLYYRMYPLYKKPWMIKKIPLQPPIHVVKEWYTETVIGLMTYYGLPTINPSRN